MALFFYFALNNEMSARAATIKSILMVSKSDKKKSENEKSMAAQIVEITNRVWNGVSRTKPKKKSDDLNAQSWVLPEDLDLGAWKQFAKQSEPEELHSVIWSKLLKFSDEEIAAGLGVTVGTIRHRVGRGLRLLGELKMY